MLSFHDYKCAAIRYVAAKALNPRCHMKVLQDDSGLRPWHCVFGIAIPFCQFLSSLSCHTKQFFVA